MKRKAIGFASIILMCGCVVAIVRAQDETASEATQERSVLVRGPSASRESSFDADARVGSGLTDDAGNRPKLVDRLRQIRQSATSVTDAPAASITDAPAAGITDAPTGTITNTRANVTKPRATVGTGPVAGPVTLNPIAPAPRQLEVAGSEPNLLPAATVDDADARGAPASVLKSTSRATLSDGTYSARRPRVQRRSINTEEAVDETTPDVAAVPEPSAAPFNPVEEEAVTPIVESTRPGVEALRTFTRSADERSLFSSSGPAIRVDTVGPSAVLIGLESEYKVHLLNMGRTIAENVFVRVVLPSTVEIASADATVGATQVRGDEHASRELIWNASQLAGGARETLTLALIPRENRPFNLTVDWTLRPASSFAQIEVQQPQLEMAVFGPSEIMHGQEAVYTIRLANPGTGIADEVVVDFGYGAEQLPAKNVGQLQPGEQTEIRVELSARQAGALRLTATARGAGGLRAEVNEEVLVRRAKLEVSLIGSAVKFAGSVATYELQVRNVGDAIAEDVNASVTLPSGAKYVGQLKDLEQANGKLTKQLGSISPGSERTFRLHFELSSPGDNLVDARAVAAGDLIAGDTFVTRVKALADLKLVVNDPPGPTALGSEAAYEILVVNRGTKAAHQVQVVAQFSQGVEPVQASGTTARLVPGQVLFQPISRIDPGQEIRLKITAKADLAGNHRFRAEVKCAEPETLLVAEESTYFFGDEISTARPDSGTTTR